MQDAAAGSAIAGRGVAGFAPSGRLLVLAVGLAGLLAGLLVSLSVGAGDIPFDVIWRSILTQDRSSTQAFIVNDVRLPRVMLGAMIGAAFAVSGAVIQAITRNPLGEPGLMGLNAGAAFLLAVAVAIRPSLAYTALILISFLGAAMGAAIVFGLGTLARGRLTPVRLALAGAAVSYLLTSLATGLALYEGIAEDILYYTAGGIAGVGWPEARLSAPWLVAALVGVLALSRQLTVLTLGDDVAAGLGQRTVAVKAAAWLLAVVLAGVGVAVGGPVGFVGLMIPHISRSLVGIDYRFVVPCSAVLGGLLVVLADVGARMVAAPREVPIGFITALVGVPFFLYLARTNRRMW